MLEKVRKAIQKHGLIEKGDRVIAGISGGPDSVCLLHVLWRLSEELDLAIIGVHINHRLRGEAADRDQCYTEKLCGSLGIPCRVFSFDVKKIAAEQRISTEDAGRRVRYQAFAQVRQEMLCESRGDPAAVAAVKIAVAQNSNDQAETLLMRLMRGTGPDGLAGIEYKRDEVFIRPLLGVTRNEIEVYCSEQGLEPCIDQTNLEAVYTRNKIRLELLPYMEQNFNEHIVGAFNRLAGIAAEDRDYFRETVDRVIREHGRMIGSSAQGQPDIAGPEARYTIPAEILREQHPAIRKRIILKLFEQIGLVQDIGAVHLAQAEQLLQCGRASAFIDFPGGFCMGLSYGTAVFEKKAPACQAAESDWFVSLELPDVENEAKKIWLPASKGWLLAKLLKGKEVCISEVLGETEGEKEITSAKKNPRCALLDYESILESGSRLVVRTRRPGDFIQLKSQSGTKKLQDFFVDRKVPKETRDSIPLVADGSEIIWVAGLRVNEKYRAGIGARLVLLLEYSNEI